MDKKTMRGIICAVIGGICWGFSGCCSQYLFSMKGMNASWLTPVRLLVAGSSLLVVSYFKQRENLLGALRCKPDFSRIVSYGVFGLMFCQYTYQMAISLTNAATATVIQYAGPVLVMLVVCLQNRKVPTIPEALSLMLAVIGTFLIATHGDPTSLIISPAGLVWCILSALSMVPYTLLPVGITERRSSMVVSGYGMLAGGILLSLICRVWRISVPLDLETLVVLFGGVILIGTIVALTVYLQAISDIGPVQTSVIVSVEPVASALISFFWLGSTFKPIDILGFICVISTVFLLAFKPVRKHKEKMASVH